MAIADSIVWNWTHDLLHEKVLKYILTVKVGLLRGINSMILDYGGIFGWENKKMKENSWDWIINLTSDMNGVTG